MYDIIYTAEERLELARKIAAELSGDQPRDGLTVREIDAYTIVDDGQDRWIDSTDHYDESAEGFLAEVLDGKYDGVDYIDTDWYSDFCGLNGCIYSNIGTPSDVDELVDALECTPDDMLEIFDALGFDVHDPDTLPAMIRVLWEAGERCHGGAPVDAARGWIEAGFDADEAEAWTSAEFWDATTAAECRDAGLDAADAVAASESLIDAETRELDELDQDAYDRWTSRYTDCDPIYSCCNRDTEVSVLVDEHKRLSE